MNQKDYKAIAEIIKENLFEIISSKYDTRGMGTINDLADYFEKRVSHKRNPIFNRSQFLKDCGVE